jgi:hypothetical protein
MVNKDAKMNDDVGIGTMLTNGFGFGIVTMCPPKEKRHKNSNCEVTWFNDRTMRQTKSYIDYGLVIKYHKLFLEVAS